ncbi:hypothetical protein X975_02736, partial [Stegodyphus mimosarum]
GVSTQISVGKKETSDSKQTVTVCFHRMMMRRRQCKLLYYLCFLQLQCLMLL